MMHSIDDDDEVTVPKLNAPRFSQRPTPLLPPINKQYSPIKYKFYLIGVIIVTIIILAIIFITKPLQSHVMYEHNVYNLPAIVVPADPTPSTSSQPIKPNEEPAPTGSSKPAKSYPPKYLKPIIKIRDYGI